MTANWIKTAVMPAVDLLSCEAAQSYFETREHQSFYAALKRVQQRRDFHSKLITSCTRFFKLTALPTNVAIVDDLIGWSAKSETNPQSTKRNTVDEARRSQPRGCQLLGVKDPLTLDGLKKAYRIAAHKNHPDHGGLHTDMVCLNEAYATMHKLLLEQRLGASLAMGVDVVAMDGTAQILTCQDFRYLTARLLFIAHLDDWAVDEAFGWLKVLLSDGWHLSATMWESRDGNEPRLSVGQLATRLRLANKKDEIEFFLRHAGSKADDFRRIWARETEIGDAKKRKKPKIILNHRRQADNAWRLGVIDRQTFDAVIAKLAAADSDIRSRDVAQQEALSVYMADPGFTPNLPPDASSLGKSVRSSLVPEPNYFQNRLCELTDDQQAEYAAAFRLPAMPQQIRKYFFVRLQSILETAILHKWDSRFGELERECRFLSTLFRGSSQSYATDVAETLQFLAGLSAQERDQRLCYLRTMHSDPPWKTEAGYKLKYRLVGENSVRLTNRFFDLVRSPISALHALANGQ